MGTPSVSANDVVLVADHVKPNTWGLFFKGDDQLLPGVPMGGSNANGLLRCATKIKRFPALKADAAGHIASTGYVDDLHARSDASACHIRHYRWWYRTPKEAGPRSDPSPGGANTFNGYSIR